MIEKRLKVIEEQMRHILEVQSRIESRQDKLESQAQENAAEMVKIKEFIGYQNTSQDSRKLRIVK